jgi:hypothetical protein
MYILAQYKGLRVINTGRICTALCVQPTHFGNTTHVRTRHSHPCHPFLSFHLTFTRGGTLCNSFCYRRLKDAVLGARGLCVAKLRSDAFVTSCLAVDQGHVVTFGEDEYDEHLYHEVDREEKYGDVQRSFVFRASVTLPVALY